MRAPGLQRVRNPQKFLQAACLHAAFWCFFNSLLIKAVAVDRCLVAGDGLIFPRWRFWCLLFPSSDRSFIETTALPNSGRSPAQ
jgi:hypothetical protein